ncbi:MAG: enoyl-CoA hydratase [Alphaproteobacteria bacterium]|nr:enoyl-CoA hydratase [Alphaproteobacteria bacterium]
MSEIVGVEIENAVATITLNRPEALNALNIELAKALADAVLGVEVDEGVRCVVIRGAGGHFMAGGDLKFFKATLNEPAGERRRFFRAMVETVHPTMIALRRMNKPVIASVEGAAAGFGMSLMLACDLAIAAENAYFSLAYVNIGTSPDGSGTFFLPRAVGLRRAMEIALLGERFDAKRALELALINRVVSTEALGAETEKLARRLANGPTLAIAATKQLLNRSLEVPLEAQLEAEAASFSACAASEDFVEGINAFIEKRKPAYRGR